MDRTREPDGTAAAFRWAGDACLWGGAVVAGCLFGLTLGLAITRFVTGG